MKKVLLTLISLVSFTAVGIPTGVQAATTGRLTTTQTANVSTVRGTRSVDGISAILAHVLMWKRGNVRRYADIAYTGTLTHTTVTNKTTSTTYYIYTSSTGQIFDGRNY